MRKKGFSNHEFLERVREYLPENQGICETDGNGNCLEPIPLSTLSENTFYLFDSDAVLAITHAIQDWALEEASGSFMTAIQDCRQFEEQRERFWQLAATLEEVQVIALGQSPRRLGRVKFCADMAGFVQRFWLALYEGNHSQVMILCEQAKDASEFEQKQFTGFYTFNPRIIAETREDIAQTLLGRCPEFRQFAQLNRIDRAAKQLKIEFARERKAMDVAIKKLQGGKRHEPAGLIAELDRTLARLNRLKAQLPDIIIGRDD